PATTVIYTLSLHDALPICDVATGEAIEWIRSHAAERFFAWVHLYDPHDPYEPPGQYAVTYADRPYDGEVAWCDELVGRLLAALRSEEHTSELQSPCNLVCR